MRAARKKWSLETEDFQKSQIADSSQFNLSLVATEVEATGRSGRYIEGSVRSPALLLENGTWAK